MEMTMRYIKRLSILFVAFLLGCGSGEQPQWVTEFEGEVRSKIQIRQDSSGLTAFADTAGNVIPVTEFIPTDITDIEWRVLLDEDSDLTEIHVKVETFKQRLNAPQREVKTFTYQLINAVRMDSTSLMFLASQEDLELEYDFPHKIRVLQIEQSDLNNNDGQVEGIIQEVAYGVWIRSINQVLNFGFANTIPVTSGEDIKTEGFFKLQYQDANVLLAQVQNNGMDFDEGAIPTTTSYATILLEGDGPETRTISGQTGPYDTSIADNPPINSSFPNTFGNR